MLFGWRLILKIGIDAFGCDHGMSGIGAYILSLVKNLPKSNYEFQLFGPELDKYTYTSNIDYINFVGVDISDARLAEKIWHFKDLNLFIKKQKYDAVIYPSGIDLLPPIFTVPSVLVFQRVLDNNVNFLVKFGIKRTLKNITGVISPSKFIQKKLIEYGVNQDNIRVIYNGIDNTLFYPMQNQNESTVLMQPFSIRKPYIIYASRLTVAEKCHVELIKAFVIFKKKFGTDHRLVIAGSDGENAENVHEAVLASGYSSDILLTGYFPHESLPALYGSADLCIFPSRVEGVGLPVIEAMACGIPTACANAGALPEVAGDATVFFDPKNPEEIADAISSLIDTEENYNRREILIKKGLEWVLRYNWKTTAEETISYLDDLFLK